MEYHQDGWNEVASIKSAGPDAVFGTIDDIARTRKATNIMGNPWSWVILAWIGCMVLAFAASAGVSSHRVRNGKSGRHRHPVAFVLGTACFAPVAFLLYGLQFLGGALGATGDFFDGFDFDFDFDIDIDL